MMATWEFAGIKALARSYIWWPGVDKEIEDLAKGCEPCRSVSAMPTTAPRHPWQSPNSPWDRVHVDFGEWNRKHFLVVVDAYSKWPEVRYMSSTTAQQTIEVLQDIFATHGFPRLLVSDNGPQFIADNFVTYLCSNQIAHHKSAPYHPATNGLAENMVKNVKQWLKKQETELHFLLCCQISCVLIAMYHTLKQDDHRQSWFLVVHHAHICQWCCQTPVNN